MKNENKNPALKTPTPAELGGAMLASELRQILISALHDMYWTEKLLLKSLPLLCASAATPGLKLGIEEHIAQTGDHVKRLDRIFALLGVTPEEKPVAAARGLISEGEELVSKTSPDSMTRDAAIILAAQRIEHYEIASYGSLLEFARTLGLREVAGLLHLTLDEEKLADQGLSLIAQTGINWQAEHEVETEPSEAI